MPLVVTAASNRSLGGRCRDFQCSGTGGFLQSESSQVLGLRLSLWPELLEVLQFLDRLLFCEGSLGNVLLL